MVLGIASGCRQATKIMEIVWPMTGLYQNAPQCSAYNCAAI
jgi:hypothetical protein